jgi:eukaryotic-like serine/threonine-protein kinase
VPIATGTKLGQYEVQDFLGQGAMGLVYLAYHQQLERTGAVKVLQAISPDADTVARFRHEAQAIAQLRHPNIVNVYDFGEYQGTPYMVVEYVPGGSLAAKMTQGRLDRAAALKYLRGIAAGLDYAHAHGVVHRDVKPANVLLSAEDVPVLADFGLAKLLQGTSLKSMTGVTTGTPAYMAPEQVTGGKVGPASDRYSLATIAYEMLTGVIPFDGLALMELLYAQVHREPQLPSSRYPSLGPEVDSVIMRGLAKDPAARWESSSAFVDALSAAMNGAPAPALAPTMVMAPPVVASTVPIAAVAPPIARKPAAATVAMAYPMPAAAAPAGIQTPPTAAAPSAQPRRHLKRNIAIAAAAALLLVLLLGVCSSLLAATTLALNPSTATRLESVQVTATKVPANQVGVIELHSTVHTYAFRADSNGKVSTYITVPQEIAIGDHTVKICWSGTCHASQTLHVVAGVALASPTPIANPSGSSTPGQTPHPTPTAGSSPRPTSYPTSNPTSHPTSTPTSQPTSSPPPPPPTPSPTSNPCPGNSNALVLTPPSQSAVLNTTASFTGSNFTPNSNVTVSYKQGAGTPTPLPSVKASCSGGISVSVTVPGGIVRTDHVIVCDVAKGCISETINVLL